MDFLSEKEEIRMLESKVVELTALLRAERERCESLRIEQLWSLRKDGLWEERFVALAVSLGKDYSPPNDEDSRNQHP